MQTQKTDYEVRTLLASAMASAPLLMRDISASGNASLQIVETRHGVAAALYDDGELGALVASVRGVHLLCHRFRSGEVEPQLLGLAPRIHVSLKPSVAIRIETAIEERLSRFTAPPYPEAILAHLHAAVRSSPIEAPQFAKK